MHLFRRFGETRYLYLRGDETWFTATLNRLAASSYETSQQRFYFIRCMNPDDHHVKNIRWENQKTCHQLCCKVPALLRYKHWLHVDWRRREQFQRVHYILECVHSQRCESKHPKVLITNVRLQTACVAVHSPLQRSCLHSKSLKVRRNATVYAYSFNGYVHCFPGLSKRQTSGRC
jgi:hypothetical protein